MIGRSSLWREFHAGIIVSIMDILVRKSVSGLVVLCCLLSLLSAPVRAQQVQQVQQLEVSGETEFLRFLEGDGEFAGELQTSVTTYRNDQGVEVDLVATVHLADRSYFTGLNDYFTTRDAILYELVADENVRPNGQGVGRGSGFIGFLQTSLTRVLGLSYQLDVINYARPNFFHADLEPQELDAVMEAKGETLFSSILSLVLTEIENQEQNPADNENPLTNLTLTEIMRLFSMPNRQEAFKYLLGQNLAMADNNLASITGRGITILDDRNDAALEVLQAGLRNPTIGQFSIFYGAAHMPGIEQGIVELGFTRTSQSWLTAWKTE